MENALLTKNLGLSPKEARVYLAILQLGDSTIQPIARHSGVRRTSIYYFINRLVDLGLIESIQIRGRAHFKACSPQRIITLSEERLQELQNSMPEFLAIFNNSGTKPKVSYYEGEEQIQKIMLEEVRCEKEVLGIWPGKIAVSATGGPKFMEKLDRMRRAKGVLLKVIRVSGKEPLFSGSGHGIGHMREIRFASPEMNFPIAVAIYDTGKVGFITSRKEGFGLMIESREVYEAMKFFFYLFWEQAIPAMEGEG